MEDIKLTLIWDEVLGEIISFIKEGITNERGSLIYDIIFKPLIEGAKSGIVALQKMLVTPFDFFYFGEIIEYLCLFAYICVLGSLVLRIVSMLIVHIIQHDKSQLFFPMILMPLKTVLILQLLQFIGVPILLEVLEKLPHFIHVIWLFIQPAEQAQLLFTIAMFTQELQFIQCILLLLVFGSLLAIVLQCYQFGVQITLAFLHCYFTLFTTTQLLAVFAALKRTGIRVTILFCLQQFLVLHALHVAISVDDIAALLRVTAVILIASIIPLIVKNERLRLHA